MQPQFNFCYTEGKPETLVLLKNVRNMPALLFASPEENVFVWVGQRDNQNLMKVRDQIERDLGHCIYLYETVDQAIQQLNKDRPQCFIVIIMIQLFQSWRQLNTLERVKALYFYSESIDYEHYMKPLRYKQMEDQEENSDQSIMQSDEIQIQQNEANQWVSNVYTKTNELVEKLKEHKGITANRNKALPNFLFMDQKVLNSQILIRTFYSMLNQEIDEETAVQINKKFETLVCQIIKIDPKINKQQKNIKEFFTFITDKQPKKMKDILMWYTKETFVYKLLNNLLRAHSHPTEIYFVQPYFVKLFNSIKQLYHEQSNQHLKQICDNQQVSKDHFAQLSQTEQPKQYFKYLSQSSYFRCYRGGLMKNSEFQLFKKYEGTTVQNLGFFSTSLNLNIAFSFYKNVMFQIIVQRQFIGLSQFGFADIKDFSKSSIEQEILFNPLNTFQIITVKQTKLNEYQIRLRYLALVQSSETVQQKMYANQYNLQIAKLQRQQKYLNICQGNSLTNQYYNLQGADTYWDKYMKIVDDNLKNKIGNQNIIQLKRAFGLFNKSNHKRMNPKWHQDVYWNLGKLKQLLGDQNQIVQKYRNSRRNHPLKFSSNSHILNQQERTVLFSLPEYKFLSKINFHHLQIMEQKKYLINETLNLNNYGQKNIQATIMEIGKQFGEKIKKIKLQNNAITYLKENIFQMYKNLQELDLELNKMKELPKSLINLHNLTTLNLGDNKIGDNGVKVLVLGNLNSLTDLDLWSNQIGDDGAKELASGNLNNLTTLNLYQNQIRGNGAKELASGNLNNLTSLKLRDNKIRDNGAKGLASGNLNRLTNLDLGSNQIGDDGAKGLASGNLNNLKTLNLDYNQIRDNGAKELASGNLNNLTSLNLNWNQIGDDGAKELASGNLNNLTSLKIARNKIQNSSLIKANFLIKYKETLILYI